MRTSLVVLGSLGLMLSATAPIAAQARSVVTSAELASAVASAPATNQATVQHFLQDHRVVEVANRMGISIADLAAGVSTLDDAALSQLADRTRAADRELAGGDKVLISTTVIIIALLVVILLIVA